MNNIERWCIYTDGASRGNPGKAGIGVVIYKNSVKEEEFCCSIGLATNNQAEYLAFIAALLLIKRKSSLKNEDHVFFYADSLLMVKQINREYAIKNKGLCVLYDYIQQLSLPHNCTIKHVRREQNIYADALANKGIDHEIKPPVLLEHGMSLLKSL